MVPAASDRIPPVPPYSGLHSLIADISNTGLSPSAVYLPRSFLYVALRLSCSFNPVIAVTTTVWAVPISLTTTLGIIIIFSSYRYLDVSVPCVRSDIFISDTSSTYRVPPFGYPWIISYVPIPMAFRSLSRPSSPLRA